ncbi:DUF2756 domain-containing protein [Pluralibacter gergoviae]
MKKIVLLATLLPFAALAQPLNPTNNPNQPGYINRSQQRMQNEMQSQQIQQKGMLNQQLQNQTRQQQQQLHSQLQGQQLQIQRAQPGGQMVPNNNPGTLNSQPGSSNIRR